MTGPSHYERAEELLDRLEDCENGQGAQCPSCGMDLAEAQVHATLALAAATAIRVPGNGYVSADWMSVAGGTS